MSDSTIRTADPAGHFTVEDAGSTTDPADLIDPRPEGDSDIDDQFSGGTEAGARTDEIPADDAPATVTGRMLEGQDAGAKQAGSGVDGPVADDRDLASPVADPDVRSADESDAAATWDEAQTPTSTPTPSDETGGSTRTEQALPDDDSVASAEAQRPAPAADEPARQGRTEDVGADDRGHEDVLPAADERTRDDEAPVEGAETAPLQQEAPAEQAPESPFANLGALGDIGHVFDQTNGVIDGLDGDSDGTAAWDDGSATDREHEWQPIGAQDTYADDHGLTKDDPNP